MSLIGPDTPRGWEATVLALFPGEAIWFDDLLNEIASKEVKYSDKLALPDDKADADVRL